MTMPPLLVAVRPLTLAMPITTRHTDIRYAPLTIYITLGTLIHWDVALNVAEAGQLESVVECHHKTLDSIVRRTYETKSPQMT